MNFSTHTFFYSFKFNDFNKINNLIPLLLFHRDVFVY